MMDTYDDNSVKNLAGKGGGGGGEEFSGIFKHHDSF
jgi:hypothetical protein